MWGSLICFIFCFTGFINAQDQFWRNIEKTLLSDVDLTDAQERSKFLKGLMQRATQLNAINQRVSNQILIKNNQEAIQALLSVYIYVTVLSRYLETEKIRETISNLEKKLLNARGFPKQEKSITDELNNRTLQLNNLYSQKAIETFLTATLQPFPFITLPESQISAIAADIQNFIGDELYFAHKSLSLNPDQIRYLYRYIQVAPLISEEYVQRNGRFYLTALKEALGITNAMVQIHLKNNEKRYQFRQQELLKKIIALTSNDLTILSILSST